MMSGIDQECAETAENYGYTNYVTFKRTNYGFSPDLVSTRLCSFGVFGDECNCPNGVSGYSPFIDWQDAVSAAINERVEFEIVIEPSGFGCKKLCQYDIVLSFGGSHLSLL